MGKLYRYFPFAALANVIIANYYYRNSNPLLCALFCVDVMGYLWAYSLNAA